MDRDFVLWPLVAFLCGPLLFLSGWFRAQRPVAIDARSQERACWWQLWWPVFPAGIAFAILFGWALQEPERTDERLQPFVFAVAAPFCIVWLRAISRAVWSLGSRALVAAATVGLLRPRVMILPTFARMLDDGELAAVRAHEAAHARHHDPLRIWLARLAADLQWPSPSAAHRLTAWSASLELARDEEACANGVDPADLAAAIVTAARFGSSSAAVAGLMGAAKALRERVDRLLTLSTCRPAELSAWTRHRGWLAVGVSLIAATSLGAFCGDEIVRMLPGVLH